MDTYETNKNESKVEDDIKIYEIEEILGRKVVSESEKNYLLKVTNNEKWNNTIEGKNQILLSELKKFYKKEIEDKTEKPSSTKSVFEVGNFEVKFDFEVIDLKAFDLSLSIIDEGSGKYSRLKAMITVKAPGDCGIKKIEKYGEDFSYWNVIVFDKTSQKEVFRGVFSKFEFVKEKICCIKIYFDSSLNSILNNPKNIHKKYIYQGQNITYLQIVENITYFNLAKGAKEGLDKEIEQPVVKFDGETNLDFIKRIFYKNKLGLFLINDNGKPYINTQNDCKNNHKFQDDCDQKIAIKVINYFNKKQVLNNKNNKNNTQKTQKIYTKAVNVYKRDINKDGVFYPIMDLIEDEKSNQFVIVKSHVTSINGKIEYTYSVENKNNTIFEAENVKPDFCIEHANLNNQDIKAEIVDVNKEHSEFKTGAFKLGCFEDAEERIEVSQNKLFEFNQISSFFKLENKFNVGDKVKIKFKDVDCKQMVFEHIGYKKK